MSRSTSISGLTDNVNLEDIYEYDWADSDSESPGGKHEKESYIVQEVLADFLKVGFYLVLTVAFFVLEFRVLIL